MDFRKYKDSYNVYGGVGEVIIAPGCIPYYRDGWNSKDALIFERRII